MNKLHWTFWSTSESLLLSLEDPLHHVFKIKSEETIIRFRDKRIKITAILLAVSTIFLMEY